MLKYCVLHCVVRRSLIEVVSRFWQSVKELIYKVERSVVHSKPVVKVLWNTIRTFVDIILWYCIRKFIKIILQLHYDLILVSSSWKFAIRLVHEASNGAIEIERSLVRIQIVFFPVNKPWNPFSGIRLL